MSSKTGKQHRAGNRRKSRRSPKGFRDLFTMLGGFSGPARSGASRWATRRPLFECFEPRYVLTSVLYLDFGDNFPVSSLQLTADELRETFANGGIQGPDLVGDGDPDIAVDTQLTFAPLSSITGDFNGNGDSADDYATLRDAVVNLVSRYYAPFDVNVQIAPALDNTSSGTYLQGIRDTLNLGLNQAGERDVWVFVSSVTRLINGNPESVGENLGLNGVAANADIPGNTDPAGPNDRDDSAIVFAENILDGVNSAVAAATRLAYTAAHEAAHTFGMWHIWNGVTKGIVAANAGAAGTGWFEVRGDLRTSLIVGEQFDVDDEDNNDLGTFTIAAGATFDPVTGRTRIPVEEAVSTDVANDADDLVLNYDSDQWRVVRSDLIPNSAGSTNRLNLDFFTRYPLINDYAVNFQGSLGLAQPYELLVRDENLGPRANGPAYITGTGAFDRIQVERLDATSAQVTVEAFRDADLTDLIGAAFTYIVDYTDGLLIDAGFSSDQIIVDARLGVDVLVRGMAGSDTLIVDGNGVATATYTPGGAELPGLDGIDSYVGLITAGATTINFEEFEPLGQVVFQDITTLTVTTPNAEDRIAYVGGQLGSDRNRLEIESDGVDAVPVEFFNVTNVVIEAGANDGAGAEDVFEMFVPATAAGLLNLTINGGPGNDRFLVQPSTTATLNVNGGPPVDGDPGVPPGDILSVNLIGVAGAAVPSGSPDGSIVSASHRPVNFTSIETLIASDRFERNDSIATATVLGSKPAVTLRDLSIHHGDEDFFSITAHSTGKLLVRMRLDNTVGDLDLQILDASGDVIATSAGVSDEEFLAIPVVTQETYFVRVFGASNQDVGNYSLEIENFGAPIPDAVRLDRLDDSGLASDDRVTNVRQPRFVISADLLNFVDENRNGQRDANETAVLTAAEADGTNTGYAVQTFIINANTGAVVEGFADPLNLTTPLTFEFTPSVPLADGDYYLVAATRVFDGQDPIEQGRTLISEPLYFVIDGTAPVATAPDLAADSDSGFSDSDNVTNIRQVTLLGTGEAGAQFELFVTNVTTGATQRVATGRVGTDLSDGVADGLGEWSATTPPLDDGLYDITVRFEDLAGNVGSASPALRIEIDTLAPNLPGLDLLSSSDSGRSDTDDITNDNTPTFAMTSSDRTASPADYAHLLAENLAYRVFLQRDGDQGVAESLVFDSFQLGGLTADSFIERTLTLDLNNEAGTALPDGLHGFLIEVEDRAGNISHEFVLPVLIDTVAFLGDGDLHPDSDTGIAGFSDTVVDRITSDTLPSFFGTAEANSLVTVLIDGRPAGTTVALPLDGNDAFQPPNAPYTGVQGNWRIDAVLEDDGGLASVLADGEHSAVFTFEDPAGNRVSTGPLTFFVDTEAPVVENVVFGQVSRGRDPVTMDGTTSVFRSKPSLGPDPLIHSLVIEFSDGPERTPAFLYDAVFQALALEEGNYRIVGDATGEVTITEVNGVFENAAGERSLARIELVFARPLPDDRFTLTISDRLSDAAGNSLDGESGASAPFLGNDSPTPTPPQLPSGDGEPGGVFVGRFTIDSRAEIGTWAGGSIWVDTNGNGSFDPDNIDYVNRDIIYALGITTDDIFVGNFVADAAGTADGFDKIAAYGFVNGGFRWLIDVNNDGVVRPADGDIVAHGGVNGLPIAGNFDGNATNGDEIGLFTGTEWHLDTNHDFILDTVIPTAMRGLPFAGDFNGDGVEDLGTWADDFFQIEFGNGAAPPAARYNGVADAGFRFGFIGVRERPVAADMDGDGFDDIGLWVPDREGQTPRELAEWYFLVSDGAPVTNRIRYNANMNVNVIDYKPDPFGPDLYFQFGDDFALPLVGNLDPPSADDRPSPLGLLNFNTKNPFDVNDDGRVDARDVRVLITEMITRGPREFTTAAENGIYTDVDRNGRLSSADLTNLIAVLLTRQTGDTEGEDAFEDYFTALGRDEDLSGLNIDRILESMID